MPLPQSVCFGFKSPTKSFCFHFCHALYSFWVYSVEVGFSEYEKRSGAEEHFSFMHASYLACLLLVKTKVIQWYAIHLLLKGELESKSPKNTQVSEKAETKYFSFLFSSLILILRRSLSPDILSLS